MHKKLFKNASTLLQELIATPSFSKEEEGVASIIADFFEKHGVHTNRQGNNIWVKNKSFDLNKTHGIVELTSRYGSSELRIYA